MSEQLHSINEVLQDLKAGKTKAILLSLQSLRRKKILISW